jgi:hypothetical protein
LGDHGHAVNQGGGRDEGVALGSRVGYVQSGTLARHVQVHRQNAAGEGRQDLLFQPRPQQAALLAVAAFGQQHAGFQLEDGDGRDK